MAEDIAGLDSVALWELMSTYNWDDGFALPAAVVRHPNLDRGLALRLFWELDDSARIFIDSGGQPLEEIYSAEAKYEPEDFRHLVAYVETLVEGLRTDAFAPGPNAFDTGFFGTDDPELTDRQRKIREINTRRARETYADGFLRPESGA